MTEGGIAGKELLKKDNYCISGLFFRFSQGKNIKNKLYLERGLF